MKKFFRLLTVSFWVEQFSRNHINLIQTLWINFHFLPLKQAIHLPIFVYGRIHFIKARGKIEINANVYAGMITINKIKSASCAKGGNTELVLHKLGKITFQGSAYIGCGCCLNVNIGNLVIGKDVTINHQNNIGCFNRIEIGENTRIGHQNQIFDTNFHHTVDTLANRANRSNAPITIGKNCWVTNRVTIMPGISLPDFTIVSSNSLLTKNVAIEPNQLIGGIPARLIKGNIGRVWDKQLEAELHFYFRDSSEKFYPLQ